MPSWLNDLVSWVPWAQTRQWLTQDLSVLVVLGGLWALVGFRRNNRIKAAEILLKLEQECIACLPTLSDLEDDDTYTTTYQDALQSAVDRAQNSRKRWTTRTVRATGRTTGSTPVEGVDRVLRHLHACYHVRRLGVDAGSLDRAYKFYLRMCISNTRPGLRNYVHHFWRNVFFWAERAGKPWPKRVAIYLRQVIPRLVHWWGRQPKEQALVKAKRPSPASS